MSEPTVLRAEQNAELAEAIFNPMKEKVGQKCRKLTAGEGIDIVFDCAGIQPGLQDGTEALRHGGTYLNVTGWEKPVSIAVVGVSLRSTKTFINDCANRTLHVKGTNNKGFYAVWPTGSVQRAMTPSAD